MKYLGITLRLGWYMNVTANLLAGDALFKEDEGILTLYDKDGDKGLGYSLLIISMAIVLECLSFGSRTKMQYHLQ